MKTQITYETILYPGVIATFPLAKHCRFYNAVGRIDIEALQRILGPFAAVRFYTVLKNSGFYVSN